MSVLLEQIVRSVPFTVTPETPAREAIAAMNNHRVTYALVQREGRPVGMITPHDILRWTASGQSLDQTTLAELLSVSDAEAPRLPSTVSLGATVWEACEVMKRCQVDQVAVVDETDRLIGVVTQSDILGSLTALSSLEDQFRQREARLALSLDLSNTGSWDIDLISGQTIYNDKHLQLMGNDIPDHEAGYETWEQCIHPDDRERVRQALNRAAHTQADCEIEYRVVAPSGQIRWILIRGRALYDTAGRAVRIAGISLDVTSRKRVELALMASEAQNRAILKAIPDLLVLVRKNGTYLETIRQSDTLVNLVEQEFENPIGRHVTEIMPVDVATQFLSVLEQVIETENVQVYEQEITVGDRTQYEDVRVSSVDEETALVMIRDMSDRRRVEQALRNSEARLQYILNNVEAVICSFRVFPDRNWAYDYFSPGCESILGYSAETLIANRHLWISRIVPEDVETVIPTVFEAILAGKSTTFEYRFQHPNGSIRWISDTLTSQWDEDAQCWRVTGVETVISNHKYLELALESSEQKRDEVLSCLTLALNAFSQSEEQLRAIFEQTTVGIALVSMEGQFLRVNAAYCAMTGYSEAELLEMHCEDVTHPDDRESSRVMIQQLHEGQSSQVIETRYCCKDQTTRWVNLNLTAVKFPGEIDIPNLLVAVVQDISDHKRSELEVQRSLDEKKLLLAEIHHRVKNNLQVIGSLLDLQANKLKDPVARMALENSGHRIQSMALVHEKLYRSRNFEGITLAEYMHELTQYIIQSCSDANRSVLLDEALDGVITLDLDQAIPLGLILSELISNALKYGLRPPNRSTLYVHLKRTTPDAIQLRVGNAGDTLPVDFSLNAVTETMGIQLIQILTLQLGGHLTVERGSVTWFILDFANPVPSS